MGDTRKLYQIIIDHYVERIRSGELGDGDKLPKGEDVARQFGVSAITVTHAMRQLEAMGLVKRIKKKGTIVSASSGGPLRPAEAIEGVSESAPTGSTESSVPILSLVIPFDESIGYGFISGVEEQCARQGCYVTIHNSKYDAQAERDIIVRLMADRVRGIVVYPCSSYGNADLFARLLIDRIPVVCIDRHVEGLPIPVVLSDNRQGGFQAASHLLELGHRRIAFVCGSLTEVASIAERYGGYCQALIEAGIAPRREWLIVGGEAGDDPAEVANRRLDRLLAADPPPTAVVTENDVAAMHLVKAALQRGIPIPGRLSVTGFDNLPFVEHLDVPLTTIEQSFHDIGRTAAELALEAAGLRAEPSRTVLPTRIVVRGSTAPLT